VTSVSPSTGVLVRTAAVQPYVDFSSLDLVSVITQAPRTDPRDSVLPPKPAGRAPPKAPPRAR